MSIVWQKWQDYAVAAMYSSCFMSDRHRELEQLHTQDHRVDNT